MAESENIYIDANAILRWILGDIPEQAARAKSAIATGRCFLSPEVLAEVVYVLKRVYKLERGDIAAMLVRCLPAFRMDIPELLKTALEIYGARAFDFVDCVLAARVKLHGSNVLTFDEKLLKYISKLEH